MRGLIGFFVSSLLIPSLVPLASAQFDTVTCNAAAENAPLRVEGLTEQIGDIEIFCFGGDPDRVRFMNLILIMNAEITSNLPGPDPDETEVLLLIDNPQSGVVNTSNGVTYDGQVRGQSGVLPGAAGGPGAEDSGNVYVGERMPGSPNQIQWNGVPFRPPQPGTTRSLRITNVRIDASRFGIGNNGVAVARLAVAMDNTFPIRAEDLVTGVVESGFAASVRREAGFYELIFRERFHSAFRKRIANDPSGAGVAKKQNIPGNYFTEGGFTPDFSGNNPGDFGVANTGTRFVAQFDDIPLGLSLTAPSSVVAEDTDGDPTLLEVRRVMDFRPDFSGGVLSDRDAPAELAPVFNGQATLVYEVVAQEPFEGVTGKELIDIFRIPVRVIFPQPGSVGAASVALGIGPLNDTGMMSRDAPEPRFHNPHGNDFLFPVEASPTLDYITLKYTPTDDVPVVRNHTFEEAPAVSETIEVVTGDAWLIATPKTTPETRILELSANPLGLPPGRYYGSIRFRYAGAPNDLQILPIVLDVNPQPELAVDTQQINFRVTVGGAVPGPAHLFVGGRNKYLKFEVSSSTASGGTWLVVSPVSGQTPANVMIEIDATGLPPGRYEGAVSIRAQFASNTPQLVPVMLEVTPPLPAFAAGGLVNAASYLGGGVSPGEIVTIFGSNVGPDQPAGIQFTPDGRVDTITGGTRILFDGIPAPMIGATKNQSSCVVPYNVRGQPAVVVEVEVDGWKSEPVTVPVMETWPGVFMAESIAPGHGAILNADGSLNSPANPARAGSVIVLYLTGVGETLPAGIDGGINPAENAPVPLAPVLVRIGGVQSEVVYIGGAPGMVAGAIQLNVKTGATPGEAVPVQVIIGGRSSQIVYVSMAP